MKKNYFAFFVIACVAVIGVSIAGLGNAKEKSDKENHAAVCARGNDSAIPQCNAHVIIDSSGSPKASLLPQGYGPRQFTGAYNVSGTTATNQIIAIVDAYDNPNALADLNYYSATFGIPGLSNCPVSSGTVSHPCFQKVNQNGGSSYPSVNAGWALESSLDVQAAHALCQNCNILLVEANSNSYANLMAAVDRARIMGAHIISNSYGSGEFSGQIAYDSHFNYPGIAFTFSSGDSGYGAQYPASSPYVTAVGGTTLNVSANTYVSESAWSGSGSGCSAYEGKPAFQTDSGCLNRMVADVSADADPNTGAAVYDSTRYNGRRGWFKVGGTSLSAPLIAGIYALSGNYAGSANSLPYALANYTSNMHDISTGSNGSCSVPYFCSGISGYDGPTGLGSPNGASAF